MDSQQVFIGFANLYRRFIQDFSRIATSPTAMLKITGSSVAPAFRVDDDEVVGGSGGAGVESGENVGRSDASRYPPFSMPTSPTCSLRTGFQTPQARWHQQLSY